MLGFHPIAAAPLAALIAAAADVEEPEVTAPSVGGSAGGGGGMLSPALLQDELRRLERRQKRVPKTHVIKIGDWPEEVGFVETDPLDMGEILRSQPTRSSPQHSDGDDEEEALMLLLALAA
jgi:hypothetical protein